MSKCYEQFDKRFPTKKQSERALALRHGFHWSKREDFILKKRWKDYKQDIHMLAILHKRTYKSICLRLEQLNIVTTKFNREIIAINNEIYFK